MAFTSWPSATRPQRGQMALPSLNVGVPDGLHSVNPGIGHRQSFHSGLETMRKVQASPCSFVGTSGKAAKWVLGLPRWSMVKLVVIGMSREHFGHATVRHHKYVFLRWGTCSAGATRTILEDRKRARARPSTSAHHSSTVGKGKNCSSRSWLQRAILLEYSRIRAARPAPWRLGYSSVALRITVATGFRSFAYALKPYRMASRGIEPPPAMVSATTISSSAAKPIDVRIDEWISPISSGEGVIANALSWR